MSDRCHALVVGAGPEGISTAARLSHGGRPVIVLERKSRSARDAAEWAPAPLDWAWVRDGDTAALASASAAMWGEIAGATTPKGILHLFEERWLDAFRAIKARGLGSQTGVVSLDRGEVARHFPYVNSSRCAAALYSPPGAAVTIDTRRLCSHFRTDFRKNGGRIRFGEWLEEGHYARGKWTVRTNKREIVADIVVNCAGRWADDVAKRCGTRRVGVRSSRSIGLDLSLAWSVDSAWRDWPLIISHAQWAPFLCDFRHLGRVAASVAGQEQSPDWWGADASASEVALVLAMFEKWTSLRIDETSGRSWTWSQAWLDDRLPLAGWARDVPSFFWVVGSPGPESIVAISALASDMIRDRRDFEGPLAQFGVRKERLSPDRLLYAGVTA